MISSKFRKMTVSVSLVTASIVSFSCGSDSDLQEQADIQGIPDNGPLPAGLSRSGQGLPLSCNTQSVSATRVLGNKKFDYKDSTAANFLAPDWEKRVGSDFNFFDDVSVGEPTNKNNVQFSIVLIDIRNVNGKPHYFYYGNANHSKPTENWSSTKMLGVGMALHRLRQESGGKIGGDSTFAGGSIRNDMDPLNNTSSNVLGGWYKALAGPAAATRMVNNWLNRKGENFGGFYGVGAWDAGWYDVKFTSADKKSAQNFKIDDNATSGNELSVLTQAEFMKRVGVNFRDEAQLPKMVNYAQPQSLAALQSAKPSWTKEDITTMLYGNYPEGERGGMMYDGLRDLPRNFQHKGHLGAPKHTHLDRISGGKWVSFAKGGSGCSTSRFKCEEVLMSYVCIPGANGGEGVEFAMAARLSVPDSQGSPLGRLWVTYQKVIDKVYPGLREKATTP
jgi:hypothetical protein